MGFLTTREVIGLLNINRVTLDRLCKDGKITKYKLPIGRENNRYSKEQVLSLVKEVPAK
jgi:predicted site-specific integrase-resolvase